MTLTRFLALAASLYLAVGCWSYPADLDVDSQTPATPDQIEDTGTENPDAPPVEDAVTDNGTPIDVVGEDSTGDSKQSPFHPAGWVSPISHGTAAMLNSLDCTMCHGVELDGGTSGQSCDTCHGNGWRSNCTFCHGGGDNDTGAPPKSIDGATDSADGAFPAHGSHVSGDTHSAITCSACHKTPTDATSPGHLFDDTPGAAEVDLSGGLSPNGKFANLTCSSLYCHGNGQGDNGSVPLNKSSIGCSSCHPGPTSSSVAIGAMTGRHAKHVKEGLGCYECHSGVFNDQYEPVDGSLHVNGQPNVKMPAGITYSGAGCTGTCHGEYHMNPSW